LRNTYGTSGVDYSSKIETIENSYSFLKFGKLTKMKYFYCLNNYCEVNQI